MTDDYEGVRVKDLKSLQMYLKKKMSADVVQIGVDEEGELQLCVMDIHGNFYYADIGEGYDEDDLWQVSEQLSIEMASMLVGTSNQLIH